VQYKNILATIFNEIKCHVNTSLGLLWGDASPPCIRACVQPSQKERAIGAVHCIKEGKLLQLLGWRCIESESVVFACPICENDQI